MCGHHNGALVGAPAAYNCSRTCRV
jgi:hypothetical protein